MSATTPKVQVIGVHPVKVDDDLIQQAISLKYPHMKSEQQRQDARDAVVAEMSSAALVEVIIEGRDAKFDGGDFGQPGSRQAAYMERYLSADGTAVVAEDFDVPPGDSLRLTFFLHHFHFTRSLKTSYGLVEIPPPTPMPERLRRIIHYEPVD